MDGPLRERATERAASLVEVLDLLRFRARVVVRRVFQLRVGDRQLEAVAEDLQLRLGELLRLVGDVACLDARAECPALHRLGEDHRRCATVLHGRLVRGEDLAVVVAAAAKLGQVVVGQMLDEAAEAGIGPEELLADVLAAGDRELLELAIDRRVHLFDQEPVDVAREQLVPLSAPDDLDHVPARTAEDSLELLDDLAVAADRAVEPLQVAVDDERQVVEALVGRDMQGAQGLGLVGLAVADERPDATARRIEEAAVLEVAVEPRLVDRVDRAEAHRHGRELPEVGHEPRVRIARQAVLRRGLAAEVVELLLGEAALEEGPGVDARSGVALVEDLVTRTALVATLEEPVEPDLVERGGTGVCGEVAADARVLVVGAEDHRDGVPADEPADPPLERLVARELGLLLRRDRVDVPGVGEGRKPDLELARSLEQLEQQEPGPRLALLIDDVVERADPVARLLLVEIGQLVLELVEVHLAARRLGDSHQRAFDPTLAGSRPRTCLRAGAAAGSIRSVVGSVAGASIAARL